LGGCPFGSAGTDRAEIGNVITGPKTAQGLVLCQQKESDERRQQDLHERNAVFLVNVLSTFPHYFKAFHSAFFKM